MRWRGHNSRVGWWSNPCRGVYASGGARPLRGAWGRLEGERPATSGRSQLSLHRAAAVESSRLTGAVVFVGRPARPGGPTWPLGDSLSPDPGSGGSDARSWTWWSCAADTSQRVEPARTERTIKSGFVAPVNTGIKPMRESAARQAAPTTQRKPPATARQMTFTKPRIKQCKDTTGPKLSAIPLGNAVEGPASTKRPRRGSTDVLPSWARDHGEPIDYGAFELKE